jgi:hypothetical protein
MWNLDSTLATYFTITERTRLEFRMEFYNMPNIFIAGPVEADVNNSTFGKSTTLGNHGREIQSRPDSIFKAPTP